MAVGTSDGEYYPSHLENVLTQMANTESSGQNPIDVGRVERNKAYDTFRDENDNFPAPPNPMDVRSKIKVAQAGPDNKDSSPAPDNRPDLYIDENGAQRSRKNDEILSPHSSFVDKMAKGLSQSDVDLISKYHGFESTHGKWTDDDQKRIQPLLDAVETEVGHLPGHTSTFAPNGQETIEMHDWGSLLMDKVLKQYKVLNPGRRSEGDLPDLPENARPVQYLEGISHKSDADKEMNLNPQEKDLYDRHLRNLLGPGGVDNEDGSRSTLLTQISEYDGKYYLIPTVRDGQILDKGQKMSETANHLAEKDGLDKFPSYDTQEEAEKRYAQMHTFLEKDTQNYQEATDAYKGVVNWLQNNLKTPGQDMKNWSGKEMLGYLISTGLSLIGPGLKGPPNLSSRASLPRVNMELSGKDLGISNSEPRSFLTANENTLGSGKADAAMQQIEKMNSTEFADYLHRKEADFRKEGGPPQGSSAQDFMKWVTKENTTDMPQTAYEKAVEAQQADSFIKSLRRGEKPNLTLVDRNPTQEPQGRPIPGEQARTQEAQRAANDRNYRMGKDTEKVNVGPGKGVLNDNKEEVAALIRKGSTPLEIAKRFDITSKAVQNWIKRNGPITNIEDIIK